MAEEHYRNTFAQLFAEPITSHWHREMEEYPSMGGSYVGVPYYMGRLQEINYFAMEDKEVDSAVERFVAQQYSQPAAILFRDRMLWDMILRLLRHRLFLELGRESPESKIEVAACEEYLKDSHVTDEILARRVGTTLKQIQRYNGWVRQARKDFARLCKSAG